MSLNWSNMSAKAQIITSIIGCFVLVSGTLSGAYVVMGNKLDKKIEIVINNKIKDNQVINDLIEEKIFESNKIIINKLDKIIDGVEESNDYRQVVLIRGLKKQVEKIREEKKSTRNQFFVTDVKISDIESTLDDYNMIKDKNDRVVAYHMIINTYYMTHLKSQK